MIGQTHPCLPARRGSALGQSNSYHSLSLLQLGYNVRMNVPPTPLVQADGALWPPQTALRFGWGLIPLAALAAYANTFNVPFLMDDSAAIIFNPNIRQLWPLAQVVTTTKQTTITARPVIALTVALNYSLSGQRVWSYHVVNLLVHIACGLLVYAITRRTLASSRLNGRFGASAGPLALVIALLWTAHPLQTMSVTYVIQRCESMMALFYLLTLYCVIRTAASVRPLGWQLAAVAACTIGMGCKETMASAPLVVLLYDWVFLADSWRALFRKRRWLYAGLAATWIPVTLLVGPNPHGESAGFGFCGITPWDYLKTQPGVILYYIRLAFWPYPQCFDYEWPIARTWWQVAAPGSVIVLLLGLVIWRLSRRCPWGFLGAWFFLILSVTSSVVPIIIVASEHRMYLPLATLCATVVIAAHAIWSRLIPVGLRLGRWRYVPQTAALLLVVALTTLTFRRNHVYRSRVSVWSDVLRQRPDNPRAHSNLGTALKEQGDIQGAIFHLRESVRLLPDYTADHYSLALTLGEAGRLDEAVGEFQEYLRLRPDDAQAEYNFGFALLRSGRPDAAAEHFRIATNLKPDYEMAHSGLGIALDRAGRSADAIEPLRKALSLSPNLTPPMKTLAWILCTHPDADLRSPREAVRLAERADALTQHSDASVVDTLAAAYAAGGQFDRAIAIAREARDQALARHQTDLAHAIEQRISLYAQGQPFREALTPLGPGSK